MKLSRWALRHPVPLGVVTIGALVFGIIALVTMNREFIPSLVMPTASVVSLWPGVGAEDVDRDVTEVLEEQLSTLPGLSNMKSESREGVSIIQLRFSEENETGEIVQEVRNRVDMVSTQLPGDLLGDPVVSSWGAANIPVFSFTVIGPWDADGLTRFVEDIVIPEMYKVDGVARADSLGDRKRELAISLDMENLAAMGIAPLEVLGALQGRNRNLPAGLVDWAGSEWAFRVSGEFTSREELENLIVGGSKRVSYRLGDIAEIREEYESPTEYVRSAGGDIMVVQVTKKDHGNAIEMSREIRKRLERIKGEHRGSDFAVLHDDRETIGLALRTVLNSALVGILISIVVIWLFLRSWRWTLVIAVSVPVSLVISFAAMRIAGLSINVLTMAGITVSLGMIVDASIVVLENIHRIRKSGKDPEAAAGDGTSGVASAVLASTTTSVCVFAPMMFLTGIIGSVMKDLALTLVFCLTSSLFAAILLVPPLAHKGMLRAMYRGESKEAGSSGITKAFTALERSYKKSLGKALGRVRTVILIAAAILVASIFAAGVMGISFIPSADYSELFISMELPPGSNLEDGTITADAAERIIRRELPEAKEIVFFIGMDDELSGEARRREAIWVQVLLKDERPGKRDFRVMMDVLNQTLPQALPGVSVAVYNGGYDRMVSMGAGGAGYRVEVSSESWDALKAAADNVEGLLAADPDIIGTQRDIAEERRFISADLDGDLIGLLGISTEAAALSARIAYDGLDAGTYRPPKGDDLKIRLVSPEGGSIPNQRSLERIPLRSAGGFLVSLDSVAHIQERSAVSGIRRHNRARTITIVAQPKDENIREIGKRLKESLDSEPLVGAEWKVEGIGGLVSDSFSKLGLVLFVSLFLVYSVMAIQFERLMQPLIIMASVPFCFIGVVGGLAVFGSNLSLISFLGIVALAGIVVNNAIVQIDRINRLRADGEDLHGAIINGAASRLRPILMTTLTTLFGVLPLALAKGGGARIYAPLGQAIAGGLVSSTLVTLFLIPTLYLAVERRKEKKGLAAEPVEGTENSGGAA